MFDNNEAGIPGRCPGGIKRAILVAIIAISTSSQAASKLQPRFWFHLAAVPAYGFVGLNIHEGSHALAMLATGKQIDAYKPYPHMDGDAFLYGSVYGSPGDTFTYIAPTIADITLFATSDLILSTIDPKSWYAQILWFAGMVMPLIDLAYNWNNFAFTSDISRVAYLMGVNRTVMAVGADIILAAALFEVGRLGYRVFFFKEERSKSPIILVPRLASDSVGLGVAGRF